MVNEQKSFTVTILLAVFFGWFGAHRFYTGYTGIGILQFLTMGGFGIWTLIDFLSLCFNKFKDANNNELKGYNVALVCISAILIGFILWGMFSPDSDSSDTGTSNETIQEPVEQIEVKPETHNGIAFEVISKRLVNEAYLRGFGIPSMGNSPVLVITVKIKNNGKEPYKPHIKARLLDENGAIYAGNVYTNVMEILNSSQNILNPGMEKTEVLYFKIPEMKNFIIEFQDGTFFSDTVSIKL